jgi:CDP-glucose 4,6-dehydratase
MPTVEAGNRLAFEAALSRQRVLVTGHTGFTGGWLVLWLRTLGCEVAGLALPPEGEPNLFSVANVSDGLKSCFGDIRDFGLVKQVIKNAKPSVIFHLAAQPLVSRGFAQPLETITTNVVGTAHILEAARLEASVKAVVCATTDKVYADRDWPWGYREIDRIGGNDPYAASKAGAELVAACYRATMASRANGCLIATARGGNIIGGGDWSPDRIVPDFVRAVVSSMPLTLRSPSAVRPWQHVLELVHGYLSLAGRLLDGDTACATAWNFGPLEHHGVPVGALIEGLGKVWTRPSLRYAQGDFPETHVLQVNSARARGILGWRPPLGLDDAIRLTAEWYRDFYRQPSEAPVLTATQIDGYRRELGRTQ